MEEKKLQAVLDEWQSLLPLSEEDRNRLRRRFTVDFNYNSNHLEGNTLTYGQTEILLLFGKVIGEVGVNRSALQKMLANLQEKGYVERDAKGVWRVYITPSV